MNWRLPSRVCGRMLAMYQRPDSPSPVPTDFSGELFYREGVSASFYCSFLAGNQQLGSISGTQGSIELLDFVLPYYGSEVAFHVCNPVFNISGCDFNMEEHTRRFAVCEYSNSAPNAQETNMFRRFAESALAGKPDPHWGETALKIQQVVDACLLSARSDGRMVELEEPGARQS